MVRVHPYCTLFLRSTYKYRLVIIPLFTHVGSRMCLIFSASLVPTRNCISRLCFLVRS